MKGSANGQNDLRAVHADGAQRRLPRSERVVDENLGGYRCVPKPRLRRGATRNTELQQARSPDCDPSREHVDAAWLYASFDADLVRALGESPIAHLIFDDMPQQ